MFKKYRRKWYYKNRFKTWYRKANYYYRKKQKIYSYMEKFRTQEQLSDKRYVSRLRWDMIYCLLKYGSYFDEYFLFDFEGKDDEYRSSFITESIRMSYYPRMNNPRNTGMLENKFSTYRKFPEFFKRDMIQIRTTHKITEERLEEFAEFTRKHPRYVVKPTYASYGNGFRIVDIADYESAEEAYLEYHKQGVVVEEIIIQDERMGVLHSNSVNTLRIPTVISKDEQGEDHVYLYNPTLRMGQRGSVIDNTSSGGICALIDKENGVLITDGADKTGKYYESHPDTGVVFKGFQIPEWEQAVEMVTEAAMKVPDNHYCGWDLALFEGKGWCMVEANCHAQMSGMQFVPKVGRKPELEELISRMSA
ncbi:MAG: sugar-transfer associated ATP-grasp domain-containing protein [Hespellia sp.]|nr:sugar-transfer associated ATP-grasp domain-containing protein [Hespellia sp.]